MKCSLTLAASVLLAGQTVSASLARDIVHGIRRDDATDRMMRRRAATIVNNALLEKRAPVQGSTAMNASAWDAETLAACGTTLMNLSGDSVNPSGMAVCYNLPTLDNETGAFEADMRLFRVADATGSFAGLSADGIQVGLSYTGASVKPRNSSTVAKRELYSLISWPSTKRSDGLEARANTPVLTQSYSFQGVVNKAAITSNMTAAEWEALVLPTVTLTALTAQNAPAFNTTLNSTQAAFLVGAFSGKAATTEAAGTASGTTATVGTAAAAAATTSAAAIATSTVFVMPGTKILIFPIGAIITGVWTLVGVATVMYGTFGRIQFRDQYRRQSARQIASNVSRI